MDRENYFGHDHSDDEMDEDEIDEDEVEE